MSRPANALIVDDEAHVRTYLRLILREVGIERTWEASNGPEALRLFGENRPELVLLDLNMPYLGGMAVLERLQEIDAGIPVFVVTSQSATKAVQDAAQLGAIGYALKQSPREEIVAALRQALGDLNDDASA